MKTHGWTAVGAGFLFAANTSPSVRPVSGKPGAERAATREDVGGGDAFDFSLAHLADAPVNFLSPGLLPLLGRKVFLSRIDAQEKLADHFFSRLSGKLQRRSDDLLGGHREDDTSSVDSSSGSRYPGPRRGGRQGPRAQRGKGMGVRLAQGYVGVSPESMRGTLGGQTCSGVRWGRS